VKPAQSKRESHLDIKRYKTLVFDCDGVVLNSNQLKIQAYFDVAIKYGADKSQAQALVDHHVKLGGISRYPKFEYFLREIVKKPVTEEATQSLLDDFGDEVKRRLSDCEVAPGLLELRKATRDTRWMIISGGDQTELREIFIARKLHVLFDAGIFGSPNDKDEILARELSLGNITQPALFLGDSRYDHVASVRAGLDFIFLNDWTDFEGWQEYCDANHIPVLGGIRALC
jgi:phosphoglycolate phosphatase-like HAD superfamily hydrolase